MPLNHVLTLSILLLAAEVAADDADLGHGHTQNDPTMRRILLVTIVLVTGIAGWIGFRTYLPEQEAKQSQKIATKIKKAKAKLPGWWEGGALGAGSNLQTLHETGEISAHEILEMEPPEEPPMELRSPPTRQPEEPKQKVTKPIPSPISVIPNPSPPVVPSHDNEDSIHIQEPMMRQNIERAAMEGYLLLLREFDLDIRRVNLSQQRRLMAREGTTREDILQEEDNDFSEVFMKIWEDSAAIQQHADHETDVRYAITYSQRCEFSEILTDLQDSYLLASTTHLRQELSFEETNARHQIASSYWDESPKLFLSLAESAGRCFIDASSFNEICMTFDDYWVESRALTLTESNEGCYYKGDLSLRELSARLFIMAVEERIHSDLVVVFQSEQTDLSIIKMRVVVDGAVVRGSSNRRSSKVGILNQGDVVLVEEIKYGRALLRSPRGWVSVQNQAGMTILEEINPRQSIEEEEVKPDYVDRERIRSPSPSPSPPINNEVTEELSTVSEEWGESQSIEDTVTDTKNPPTPEHKHQSDNESVKKRPVIVKSKKQKPPAPAPPPPPPPVLYTRAVTRNIVVKAAPTRTSAKVGTLFEGDIVEIEQELGDTNLVLIKQPRGYIPASCLRGSIAGPPASWSPASQDYGQITPPRSPSMASFASSVQSTLIDDFREIVLHKSEDQKLGICFAEKSRLVLEACIPGSASEQNGLEAVLGHRLIKINGINVREKPDIAPFVRESTLHLVFSKSADSGWNPATKTWSRHRKSMTPSPSQVADKFTSIALSGLQGFKKWSVSATSSERPPAAASKAD